MPIKSSQTRKEYQAKWHQENKQRRRLLRKERRNATQQWMKEYKTTLKCERCSETHPACLDFHHIGKKQYQISKMLNGSFTKDTILEEISKCIVLCSNCHRKEHFG
jgi:L-lactate utilization protein LutB